jgi:transposase-like protein/IS1 family transposase
MISHHIFYPLTPIVLVWLFLMLHWLWRSAPASTRLTTAQPISPPRKRSKGPTLFQGLTRKPHCDACEQDVNLRREPPCALPLRLVSLRGRRRQVDTSSHFCPDPHCRYSGWTGLGNISANGHPSGGHWRQLHCSRCGGYFLETHGTPFHGKRVSPEKLVWAIAALAEGLGIRAVARVFEVDPNTVLLWLVEAAEHLKALLRHFLYDVHVDQVQMDELFALLSAVKDGEVTETEAIERLSRSPHWVWVAMDPVTKLILTIDVGERTLALAQGFVHQLVQVLAPDCTPLFLTDGHKDYLTAILSHFGMWVQPERKWAQGPTPKPRWMPRPKLLYAQVIKTMRQRRLVRMSHRVVFGTLAAINEVLAPHGWQINTAFVERLHLDFRQHVAAIGRRVNTLCKHEAGLRQQLALFHVYHNFCLPHAGLRQPLLRPEPTNGMGSAKTWRPCTPAMAASLTDHVWSVREVLLYRLPPWPQPQAV